MDLALQLLVVGISQAAIYCLIATGFGLILSVTHVFHFAHAAIFAASAFFIYALVEQAGLPLWAAVPLATAASVLIVLGMQFFVYEPLRRKGGAMFTIILASIGLQFALENLLALIWGTGGRNIPNPFSQYIWSIGTVVISLTDVIAVAVAAVGALGTLAFLRYTRMGKAMRAYSDNATMAQIVGIEPRVVASVALTIGTLLAVPAALVTAWYSTVLPTMGMGPLLYSFAAVVVGGIGSIGGAVLGAILLGLLSAGISLYFPAFWSDSAAFLLMMLFIVWFPAGMFGRRLRTKATR